VSAVLRGWKEIGKYIGLHSRTAQRYERMRILKVHRPRGGGPKAPVYAFREELDAWIKRSTAVDTEADSALRDGSSTVESGEGLFTRLLDQIIKARDTKLYRRSYFLRFNLTRSIRAVQARIECEFALFNATSTRQQFVQEVTIDDRDQGYVQEMSLLANRKPLYVVKRPAITQKERGYAVYHAPPVMIEPIARGVEYLCRASWVEQRHENDLWYNHMIMPTVGFEVETHAPPELEITPPFSSEDLIMPAQHIDVAWNRRK
jgi:hypothetical protein